MQVMINEEGNEVHHTLLKENIMERDQEIYELDQEKQRMKTLLREATNTLVEFYRGLQLEGLTGEAREAKERMELRLKE